MLLKYFKVTKKIKKFVVKCVKRFLRTRAAEMVLVGYVKHQIRKGTPSRYIVSNSAFNLLVLTPNRFPPGELEALVGHRGYSIFCLPKPVVHVLINICWNHIVPLESTLHPNEVSDNRHIFLRNRNCLRSLYRRILPRLYKSLSISAVLGATPHYQQDHDLGVVSKELGVPYIILMKECLITNTKHHQRIVSYYSKIDRGSFSHILVHNNVTKEAISDSGVVGPTEISSLGCIRMDPYLERLRTLKYSDPNAGDRTKHVVLFSFVQTVGLYGWVVGTLPNRSQPGFFDLFDKVHQVIGDLARVLPDVRFTIKAKWPGPWFPKEIEASLKLVGINISELDNLEISSEKPAQDLIIDSDVVVSFGSTTMLESAIAGKPVIVPSFSEATQPEFQEYIQLKDTYPAYEIVNSPDELRDLILHRLEFPEIAQETMKYRENAFSKYVSDIEGGAAERYRKKLNEVIEENRIG